MQLKSARFPSRGFKYCSLVILLVMGLTIVFFQTAGSQAQETEPPPMVAKKIFEPPSGAVPTAPNVRGPEPGEALIVTGILVAGDHKKALIVDKRAQQRGSAPAPSGPWYREGDAVGGYTVQKIEPTNVLLAVGDQKVSIPLFGTAKDRPHPVTVSRPTGAPGSTPSQKGALLTGSQAKEKPSPASPAGSEKPSAFGGSEQNLQSPQSPEGSKAAREAPPSEETLSATGSTNPFVEALRKARQLQESETAGQGIPGSSSQ